MNVSIIFPIVTLVLLIVAIIWKLVDWRALAVKWVGNNPEHGIVYSKDSGVGKGGTVIKYAAERIYSGEDGDIYAYDVGKMFRVVVCPRVGITENGIIIYAEYPYEYISGKRIIGIKDGTLVASPLGFMTEIEMRKYEESITDISELVHGDQLIKAMKSVKPNRASDIMKYVIFAILIVAAFFIYKHFTGVSAVAPSNTANVTQSQQKPIQGQQVQPGQPGENIIPQ